MRRALFALFFLVGLGRADVAAPSAEERRIEALLAFVAAQGDVQFVRNGSAHDAATAAKFLRGKWEHQRAEVKSAEDFIARIATKSSTTGQPYLLRFKDGREIACADFLRAELGRQDGR